MTQRLLLIKTCIPAALWLLSASCLHLSYTTYGPTKDDTLIAECGYSLHCADVKDSLLLIFVFGDQSRLFKNVDSCLNVSATVEKVEAEFASTHVIPSIRRWSPNSSGSLMYTIGCPDWKKEFRQNSHLLLKITSVKGAERSTQEVPLVRFRHWHPDVHRKILF